MIARWFRRIAQLSRRLRHDSAGLAMVEFAACLPVLATLLLGGVDLSRYVMVSQKMNRVASGMGDLVAQAKTLSTSDLTNLYAATAYVASPFDFQHNGVVIISSISVVGGVMKINWQSRGSGTLNAASKIGVAGGTATLPTGLTVSGSDTLIAAEVYFNFTPLFNLSIMPARQLYHTAYFRPRLGSLNTLN
jgi:Flp pilus assembly protein TadG